MQKNACKHFLSCILTVSLVLLCIPTMTFAADSPPDAPAESSEALPPEPEATPEPQLEEVLLEEPQPVEPQPEEPQPEESQPEESLPEESQPGESLPEESQPEESLPEETLPEIPLTLEPPLEEPDIPTGPGLFFGQLHAHTTLSDGTETPEEIFQRASQTDGLDFFAVTDHSDALENSDAGQMGIDGSQISPDWAAGKAAAAAVTDGDFVGIFGYEMSWPSRMQIGHIGTFHTPGFHSWQQEAFRTYNNALSNYYAALSSVTGAVGQFNHPSTQYGTFQDFGLLSPEIDRVMTLIEVDFGARDPFRYYTKALDLGWHLAPSAGSEAARTVVYAQSLTEGGIYDALVGCRAYATEDTDLEILYTMNGHPMGSRLARRHIGESCEISVTVSDPTDNGAALVEVVSQGGTVLDSGTLPTGSGTITFSLPPASGYYYIQMTQSDADRAATAPIWVDGEENLGISHLRCETQVPVQREAVTLQFDFHNGENADFQVEALEILADGIVVGQEDTLTVIAANTTLTHTLSFAFDCVGTTCVSLRLTGTLEGSRRVYEEGLTLSFHSSQQVSGIWVDGSHGNAGLNTLSQLEKLARENDIRLLFGDDPLSSLKEYRFLLITAPSLPFSQAFLTAVEEFAQCGGSLILCGQAVSQDGSLSSAEELNRVLSAAGASMRFRADLVQDPVNHGGSPEMLYSDNLRLDSPWCAGVSEDQVYRHVLGCSVDPGEGDWIVHGRSTTVAGSLSESITLLAGETLPGGGRALAAGSLFLSDSDLAEPKNIWDAPYANRSIAETLLGIDTLPLHTVQEARSGPVGALFRIRGYVTAVFPDTLYLQDDTGGIPVVPFSGESIQQGTPLEITGYATVQNGNRALKLSGWKKLPEVSGYQYLPATGSWDTLLNPYIYGGLLMEVEGRCVEIYCREDGLFSGCLLQDEQGNQATVALEDSLFSGTDEEKAFHKKIRKGRTVRAVGILHRDIYGNTVLRVRNYEEVVYVPPREHYNPPTGDGGHSMSFAALAFSAVGLFLLNRRKGFR